MKNILAAKSRHTEVVPFLAVAALTVSKCGDGSSVSQAQDGEVDDNGEDSGSPDRFDQDAGEFLLEVEAVSDLVATRVGACVEFGPAKAVSGAEYQWQITEYPEGSATAEHFNVGKEYNPHAWDCSCNCLADAYLQYRTCFRPDRIGLYRFHLAVSRGDQAVEDEMVLLVPPVLDLWLFWNPEANLDLHLRSQSAEWGSADDASWHNVAPGGRVPDWGSSRPVSEESCDPVERCGCDQGRALGWCLPDLGGHLCQDIADDPLYFVDDLDGFAGGERITVARPVPGVYYEVGIGNQEEETVSAGLAVSWRGEELDELDLRVPPASAEMPVKLVGRLHVLGEEESLWEEVQFEEVIGE